MYNDEEHYGADTYCVHCNTPIYFDVGIGLLNCPGCGENYEKTDKQIEEEEKERKILSSKMKTPEFWIEDMVDHLESTNLYIEMMFSDDTIAIPKEAIEKSKWVRNKIREVIKTLKG